MIAIVFILVVIIFALIVYDNIRNKKKEAEQFDQLLRRNQNVLDASIEDTYLPVQEDPEHILTKPNKDVLSFKLTFSCDDERILKRVSSILEDEEIGIWEKPKKLFPNFIEYNIKCVQVEAYIDKYRPIYLKNIDELIDKSLDWNQMGEADREEHLKTIKEKASLQIQEIPSGIDLVSLFDYHDMDHSIDDQLLGKYGYEVLDSYMKYQRNKSVVKEDDRERFDVLVKKGLATPGEQLEVEVILEKLTLKELNNIAAKNEGYFKRKQKAIEYIVQLDNYIDRVKNTVPLRRYFTLNYIPGDYSEIDLQEISNSWKYYSEYIRTIVNTYSTIRHIIDTANGYSSMVKCYYVEAETDDAGDFVCPASKLVHGKKIRNNLANINLPVHVGCNCRLRPEFKDRY